MFNPQKITINTGDQKVNINLNISKKKVREVGFSIKA